ncbi:FUSC family protein [Shinella sp.]|uniref:FUSC family protein n=1 Tax=Shinella sp. TaxID=1870904 RepID=UPI004035ED10
MISVLVIVQVLTEMVIGINYALGQVLVTPMALLMTYLGAAQIAMPEIAPELVLDTLLGASVGIVMAVLLSTIDGNSPSTAKPASNQPADRPSVEEPGLRRRRYSKSTPIPRRAPVLLASRSA